MEAIINWNERKERFYQNAELLLKSIKHRKGRKPRELIRMQELLSDADLRAQLRAITFLELESKFDFWL